MNKKKKMFSDPEKGIHNSQKHFITKSVFGFHSTFFLVSFLLLLFKRLKKNNDLNFEIRMLMISVCREYNNFIASNFQEDKICVGDSEDCWWKWKLSGIFFFSCWCFSRGHQINIARLEKMNVGEDRCWRRWTLEKIDVGEDSRWRRQLLEKTCWRSYISSG